MICPKCKGNCIVVETRNSDNSVMRRRRCTNCKITFHTQELLVEYDTIRPIWHEATKKSQLNSKLNRLKKGE